MSADEAVLDARGICMAFGGNKALTDVDLLLRRGAWLGLVGPNGSGKTTLINVLSGLYRAQSGEAALAGVPLPRSARVRSRMGIARTFQQPQLAESLTIAENIALGTALARRRKVDDGRIAELVHLSSQIMDVFDYGRFSGMLPAEVPYGARKAAEVARAVASAPHVLLLDEPAAGLSSEERVELIKALELIGERTPDLAVCMIEHDLRLVAAVCPRIQVLNFGRVIAVGASAEVLRDPEVQTAYLGTKPINLDGDPA
jgi:ABC-type branched-subunit amino acid transport system ATPase component